MTQLTPEQQAILDQVSNEEITLWDWKIRIRFPREAVWYIDENWNAVRWTFNETISLLEKKFMWYITSTTDIQDKTTYEIEATPLAKQQISALKPLILAHNGEIL